MGRGPLCLRDLIIVYIQSFGYTLYAELYRCLHYRAGSNRYFPHRLSLPDAVSFNEIIRNRSQRSSFRELFYAITDNLLFISENY